MSTYGIAVPVARPEDYGWGFTAGLAVHLLLRGVGIAARLVAGAVLDLFIAVTVYAATVSAGAAVLGATVWGR